MATVPSIERGRSSIGDVTSDALKASDAAGVVSSASRSRPPHDVGDRQPGRHAAVLVDVAEAPKMLGDRVLILVP
jgi:hypothetical protein